MDVLRITRFTVDPADVADMQHRRSVLIAATRRAVPGLRETCLTRHDPDTWVDIWRWDSLANAQRALAEVAATPEAARAFALTANPSAEFVEVVDER